MLIDLSDHRAGTDKLARLDRSGIATGGLALEAGEVTPLQVRVAVAVSLLIAAAGLASLGVASVWVVATVGLAAISQYAGPPLRLAYLGAGDAVVLACYGPLAAVGAYAAQTPWSIVDGLWWASVSVGALIAMAYASHHFLHWRADKAATKQTIVVIAGESGALVIIAIVDFLAFVAIAGLAVSGWGGPALWASLLAVPALVSAWRAAWIDPLPQAFLRLIGAHLAAAAIVTLASVAAFSVGTAVS